MKETLPIPAAADPATRPAAISRASRYEAVAMGGLGVLCFSFTLPATRLADPAFGGVIVGLGRALLAAALAAALLLVRREPLPPRRTWGSLALVALGVVVGFPLLSALALQNVPAAHSAVVVGLLPSATAVLAVARAGERPSWLFWLSSGAGTTAVLVFATLQGAGRPQAGDLPMLGAVGIGAVGYAEGGRLARELGGWRVICWALILAAPFVAPPLAWEVWQRGLVAGPIPWLGLGYVTVFSMFLGFFAWYRGLALGGIARIAQIQLVQPVLTIGWAALLLGERIAEATLLAAAVVLLCAVLSQRARIGAPASARPRRQRAGSTQ